MAVTTQLTSLQTFSGTPTLNNYGGGQGAAINTDIFIEGTQSAGRRADNTTDFGFGTTFTAADLSSPNQHIKVWLFITQWAATTQVQVRISDSSNNDDHDLPTTQFPVLGGFIPVWVDVSRTPEVGGSANEASINQIGILIDIGDVGGNAPNLILDEILHGTSGLRWDGSSGDLDDFRTYENTNREGVIVTTSGVDFCYARLELGSVTATTFTDSGFTLIFPNQPLVSDIFMGITSDLQNASTDINLSNATIQSSSPSAAIKRPDFVVSGTSGSLNLTSINLIGMRTIDLTSSCTVNGGILDSLNITQGSSHIFNCTINTRSAISIACLTDPTFGTSSGLHDVDFVQSGAGHAIEIDSEGTYTLTNINFSGYGTIGNDDAAIDVTAVTGTVTLNISGGTSPTYKTAGATVDIVINPVTTTIKIIDVNDFSNIQGARVLVTVSDGSNYPFEDSVSITRSVSTATVSHTSHGLSTNDKVEILGADQPEYNGVKTVTVINANEYTFTVSGTPISPATGTITSTFVLIEGITDSNGEISSTYSFGTNQNISGTARKGSSSPLYKPASIVGTVNSTSGANITISLVPDE